MRVWPETWERIQRYQRAFHGQADRVPILAQMNEHAVKLCGGDMREYVTEAAEFAQNLPELEFAQVPDTLWNLPRYRTPFEA